MKNTTEMNLTNGNLFKKVIKFAFPLMMTNIFQLLYTTVDLWTVSEFGGGSLSMSAIGSNSALINLIVTVLASLAVGSNVCISIAKGKGDKEKADKILHTSFFVAIVGGGFVGIVGFFLAPQLLKLMGTPESIISRATTYLKIYFIGTPLMMIYNFGAQMLRALGDSKRPLHILTISGIINVLFDLLFVIVFKMDVSGVALATIISQGISAFLVITWFIINKKSFVNFSFSKFKIYKDELLEILKIGIPSGLQGLAFSIPNVMIQSSLYTINDYYINRVLITQNDMISGASAAAQIEGYIFFMVDAFAVSLVSFAGQNFGARNRINIRKSYWFSIIWMMVFYGISLFGSIVFPSFFLKIFIKESEEINLEAAILAGKERLLIMGSTYFIDGLMDINGSYLRGLKRSTPPAIVTIIGCTGLRILFLSTLFQVEYFHNIFWLYAVMPMSWILVNIVYLIIIPPMEKKQFSLIEGPDPTVAF